MNYAVSIELDVDATNVRQSIVSVQSRIIFPKREDVALRIPEWLPAFHAPRGPLQFIAGLQCFTDDKQIAWRRDPANPFRFVIMCDGAIDTLRCRHDFAKPRVLSQQL